ncbi:unnamed protein product [Effrenium voratum]|uniref:Uncharacterized protein n=1 Tax=Effrenium voratum TaxID=2562239 RepID=A0AA36NH22_9DINO|nr:unnamed protein product [Effrenium voratum]
MDELLPNPDDCSKFEPNAFKKEKCKQCGRPWTEHKGVISEEHLQNFLKLKQKAQEDKDKKEAEAQQAIAAKKAAKKRASQDANDDWFLEDDKKAPAVLDYDSDDDVGFRMFGQDSLPAEMFGRKSETVREVKVVNLIDWGECDIADKEEAFGAGEATGSSVSTRAPPVEARPLEQPGDFSFQEPSKPAFQHGGHGNQDMLTEIQHLRQMLADANEEKAIQVAIVRDEVVEKQQQVAELTRQKNEMEAMLREARAKLDSCEDKEATVKVDQVEAACQAERLEAENHAEKVDKAEAEQLAARLAEAEAKLEAAQVQLAAMPAPAPAELPAVSSGDAPEALRAASELWELCSRTCRTLGLEGEASETAASTASDSLQAELQRCRERAATAASAAEQAAAERRQLTAKLEELERRPAASPQEAQAAKALRDVRLHAEQQLAWVLQRMSVSHNHQAELQKLGSVSA